MLGSPGVRGAELCCSTQAQGAQGWLAWARAVVSWHVPVVSPYLKSLSMVTANKLLHLLEAFSTTWFLFAAAQNHHLVFFLLEIFNNIIQYQFDGEARPCAPTWVWPEAGRQGAGGRVASRGGPLST